MKDYMKLSKPKTKLDATTCFAISVLEEFINRPDTEYDDSINATAAINALRNENKEPMLRFIEHRAKKKNRKLIEKRNKEEFIIWEIELN